MPVEIALRTDQPLSPEQRLLWLKYYFVKKGITEVITDGDDTLWDMSREYRIRMAVFAENISGMSRYASAEIGDFMDTTLNGLRKELSVHPSLMQETARICVSRFISIKDYYNNPEILDSLNSLMSIYQSVPVAFPGVWETLRDLKRCGLNITLFTHADGLWTAAKVAKNGLSSFIDNQISVPTREFKDTDQLRRAVAKLGISDPSTIFYTGDSWTSDILPAMEIGIPPDQIARIKTDYSHANKGRVEGVSELTDFSGLIPHLTSGR